MGLRPRSVLRRYAWGVLVATLAVILWGAFVRASGSGAGCGSHWPLCNGEVVPRSPSIETIIELTHRVTSGVAFLLVLGMMIGALRFRPRGHPMRAAAVASFAFMVLEAAVGAGLVLFEYVADDQSVARAWWMAAHLINTFLLIGAMTLAAHLAEPGARTIRAGPYAGLLVTALALTILVGVTGAVTALGDTLFPAGSLAEGIEQDFAPTAHFLIRLRIWHPVAAVLVGLFVTGVATVVGIRVENARRAAGALIALFFLQICGGFLNLALLAPTWMQLVHLLMANLVWMGLVLLTAEALGEPAREPDSG